ncbi:unnamed protein product [Brachionus calyciflorus]|uniref:mRNA decay factor PAT1 domain-containing protein n=1 Tax=Brachionus calyciflorus TaxID=104777 RepID=A0A813M8G2_9BILA|nr:unnamed protein product [Brachionus calyciflorus]
MSNNGYFGDENEDQGFDLDPKCIDENELVASNETEDFDAFNEDTFGGAVLEDFGEDWEAQHDQLIALEDTEKSSPSASPGNKTLTKFEDYDKIDNGKFSMTSNNERTQSLLNPIQNPMASNFNNNFLKNDLFQNMDQNSVQKMQMLQQQQNLVLQQQLQKQKIQNQMNQSQLSSNPINKNINQPNLNEIQLKLIQQLQIQQQLQLQMNQQLKLQQQSAQVGNSQAKQQQQQLVQQIQYQQQLNANAILSLINSRNTILQQQQQQQQMNNLLNRKTPVNFDLTANNQNQLMSNQEKENYIQNKLAEMHLSSDKSSVIGNQQLQQQKLATAQVNPLQMISAFQQQQQQQQPSQLPEMPKPHMTKSLPNAKTLEEIENELLNQSSSRQNQSQLNQDSNDNRLNQQLLIQQQQQQQQQQLELLKMLPLLNMIQNQSQSNINPNDLQNLIQLQQQKQLLQALALQQQNSQQQQHQQQQQQFLQQQMANNQNQGFSSNLNINNLLPQNFQFMNPQQKQQVIASLAQRNLQLQSTSSQLPLNQDPNTSTNLNNINQNMLSNYMEQMKKSNQRIPLGNVNQQYQNELNQANNMKQKNDHLKLGDKLAGMMTDKEKNWVVNVQMMQLQIDDPYAYDFYYTAWMLKKNAKQNGNLENGSNSMSDNNGLKTSVLIQGNNQKHDPKNYRPLIFENSLGKVTMSNFHHPRALIDINQKSSDNYCQQSTSQLISHIDQITEHDEPKDKKNICNILLEIEKMYQVFLTIDEIEHKILKEPEETR